MFVPENLKLCGFIDELGEDKKREWCHATVQLTIDN